MFRIVVLSFICLTFFLPNIAQAQLTISFGPRVGVNFTNLVGEDSQAEGKTGLVLGLTATHSINEKSGVGVGLLYSQEGAKSSAGVVTDLNYVRVPITIKQFFGSWKDDFRPKIYAGIVPGLLLQTKVDDNEVEDLYNEIDVAATVGGGFNYRVSTGQQAIWLNVDLRYWRGITDLLDELDNVELYNQNFQLSVGLAFGLSQ